MKQHPSLILASTSFWRKELFHWLGLPYQIEQPDFDESAVLFEDFGDPVAFVKTLAIGKAMSIVDRHPKSVIPASLKIAPLVGLFSQVPHLELRGIINCKPECDEYIIGADTIVFFGGKVFGKPKDVNEARVMLKTLAGKDHQVFTGLCVAKNNDLKTTVVESVVHVDSISNRLLESYVSTGESLGKAGSYSITGEAKSFVHLQKGSLTNVLGLPLLDLVNILERFQVGLPISVETVIHQHFGVCDLS